MQFWRENSIKTFWDDFYYDIVLTVEGAGISLLSLFPEKETSFSPLLPDIPDWCCVLNWKYQQLNVTLCVLNKFRK